MKHRFDNIDREAVISKLQEHYGTKLSRIGRRKILFVDNRGAYYWILGGVGNFHGVPKEMMDEKLSVGDRGSLIVAVRKKSSIDVYAGDSRALVQGRNLLSRDKSGNYKFNVEERCGQLVIKQIPGAHLKPLTTINYSIEQNKTDRTGFYARRKLMSEFSKLTERERQEVMSAIRPN